MGLESGTRFGRYDVAEAIGKGGMGEVYRATDPALERDVALKVLPESFTADESRVARFQQEAKTLASLNHTNIAQVYGLEKADGATAIVMELVEGPTLADRIEQGPIPSNEALDIAFQIVNALEAAHEQGIVHRDLKPANIKLRPDGTVKVLDFGIAKVFDPQSLTSGPVSPVMTTPVTQAGIILGTAAYMSPEQARGKGVDQRTDIWAFGCVLYEMLTGQAVFAGEDVSITLARVLERDTNMESLPAAISPAVRHAIALCLEKDVRKRIADIRDVRLALEGVFESAFSDEVNVQALPEQSAWRKRTAIASAFLVGSALFGIGVWLWTKPETEPVNMFEFSVPSDHTFARTGRAVLAVSPDGRRFAYNTNDGIYLREMDQLEARLISGTEEEDVANPIFSPDGQSLAYYSSIDGALKRISISGGAPITITGGVLNPWDMSWAVDNTILFAQADGIYRVSASAGTPSRVVDAVDGEQLASPELLPDGDTVIFASTQNVSDWDQAEISAQSLATGDRVTIFGGGSDPHYVSTGHLIYALDDDLLAVRFDPDTLAILSGPAPLIQGVYRASGSATDSANFGIASDGTLIYLAGAGSLGQRSLVWIDRQGRIEEINMPLRNYQYAQLSPDETMVALDSRDEENDIWIFDLQRGNLQRLTLDSEMNRGAVWAPDGRVAFSRSVDGAEEVYLQAADGSGVAQQLTLNSISEALPSDIHPDGETLFYWLINQNDDIWVTSIGDEPQEGRRLLSTPASEFNPNVSPDGRWLAYQSNESGQYEIWVRPYPEIDSRRIQISDGGGTHPQWNHDGTEIYYLDLNGARQGGSGSLMAVSIEYEPAFRPEAPVRLFGDNFDAPNAVWTVYDVAEDGRFLMLQNASTIDEAATSAVIIVQHWTDELERLVPKN